VLILRAVFLHPEWHLLTSNFLTELRRRKVVRVAVVYVATAFAVLEAADIVLPRLNVPESAMTLIVVLTLLGFPIAVVLGWALELTPDGVRRTATLDDAAPSEPTPSLLGRGTVAVAALAVMLGVGLGAGWFLRPISAPGAAGSFSAAAQSIAVLPFVNMSADAGNEYFSDGISEELLNLLARVPGLQVAARTSSFAFKGENADASEIARQLRVRHVLGGSVRKEGERVRITAQLIEATNGYHLWSESYDRQLADVFAVQDEIARAIVDALRAELGFGSEVPVRAAPTGNPRAHDLYLLGLRDWYNRGDASLRSALDRFRDAVRLDSTYAPAHAGIALTWAVLPMYSDVAVEEAVREGTAAARRAIELRPDLPEAHAALGQIAQNWKWDWREAERSYARALELNPNYATAYMWRCELFIILARREEALRSCRQGLALDPLAPVAHMQYGTALLSTGQVEAARQSYTRALEFDPEFRLALDNLLFTHMLEGNPDAWLEAALARGPTAQERHGLELLHAGWSRPGDAGARAGALAVVEESRFDGDEIAVAYALLLLGETGRAMDALERASEIPRLRAILPFVILSDFFAPVARNPRFRALAQRLNLETHLR
jgi:adenylate cyclase